MYLWFCVWCPSKDVHKFPEMYPFVVISGFNTLHPLNSHPSHTSSLSSGSNLPRNGTQHLSLIYPRLLPKGFGESPRLYWSFGVAEGFYISHTHTTWKWMFNPVALGSTSCLCHWRWSPQHLTHRFQHPSPPVSRPPLISFLLSHFFKSLVTSSSWTFCFLLYP